MNDEEMIRAEIYREYALSFFDDYITSFRHDKDKQVEYFKDFVTTIQNISGITLIRNIEGVAPENVNDAIKTIKEVFEADINIEKQTLNLTFFREMAFMYASRILGYPQQDYSFELMKKLMTELEELKEFENGRKT